MELKVTFRNCHVLESCLERALSTFTLGLKPLTLYSSDSLQHKQDKRSVSLLIQGGSGVIRISRHWTVGITRLTVLVNTLWWMQKMEHLIFRPEQNLLKETQPQQQSSQQELLKKKTRAPSRFELKTEVRML